MSESKCIVCGGPMPPNAHHRAKTCSVECRRENMRRLGAKGARAFRQRVKEGVYGAAK